MKRTDYSVPEAVSVAPVKFVGRGKAVPLKDRFWEKVDVRGPDECWPWIAAKDQKGYGVIGNGKGSTVRAHCYAYTEKNGPVPKGKMVIHSCPHGDRKDCCNPGHLRIGTAKDNAMDSAIRGVLKRKLTDAQVLEIVRLRFEENVPQKAIALRFGVTQSSISAICQGRNYSWLTGIGMEEMKKAA